MSLVNESDMVSHYSRHSARSEVFPLGITKQFQLSIPRAIYNQSEFRAVPREDGALPGSLHCKLGTTYIGSTSFAVAFDVRYNELPAVRGSFFMVNWDHVAQKPLLLPQPFAEEALVAIQRRGEVNTKPEILRAPEEDVAIFSSLVTITPECCGIFEHTNYKTYIVKAFDCVRALHRESVITFSESRDFDETKVKALTIVFEKEGFLHDVVEFSLLRSGSGTGNEVQGVVSKENERIVYFRIEFYESIKWHV